MPVFPHDPANLEPAYGIKCCKVFPQDGHFTPFGAHTCMVPPGGQSRPHQHLEGETFFIARGHGTIAIGSEPPTPVRPGDVVFIPPHTGHVLTNDSPSEELWFTSVWFDPRGQGRPELPERSFMMAAPPTPNGDMHLGHLSGPYLALDAMARIRRQQGVEVRTLCGSDENQTYVQTSAKRRQEPPRETADHFSASIRQTLTGMEMHPDVWLRPLHDKAYEQAVLETLERLVREGHVVKRPTPTLWCATCDRCLVEAHVVGGCPHCPEEAGGNGCEACFTPNVCTDLREPRCAHCQGEAEMRTLERLVFPMHPWHSRLQAWAEGCAMADWMHALARRLAPVDFPVSHPGDWGIETPDGQRLFAWFEMQMGYRYSDPFPDGEWVQTFGSDNAGYYLTLLPAVQLALGGRLPTALLANRFLLLDGSKFSTSRRHAVWGDEALQHLSSDRIRLSLAVARPENGETNFSLDGMLQLQEMVDAWQTWWSSLPVGPLPRPEPFTQEDREFHERLRALWLRADKAREPESFSLVEQVEVLRELPRQTTSNPALAATAVGVWARIAEPIMPTLARKLAERVGMALIADATVSVPPAGTMIRDLKDLSLGTREQVEALAAARLAPSA